MDHFTSTTYKRHRLAIFKKSQKARKGSLKSLEGYMYTPTQTPHM